MNVRLAPLCSIEGCEGKSHSKNLCDKHYRRALYGITDTTRYERTESERFWEKVDKSGDCWLWTAYVNASGYGVFGLSSGKLMLAHRYSYTELVGPIPEGLTLDHLCRISLCVRPVHLEPCSSVVNVQRGKVLITHCPSGHPYDDANTMVYSGRRYCRACHSGQRNSERKRRKA